MTQLRFPENLLKVSLTIAIFLLLGISSENYRQFRSYSESQKRIIKSHEIQTLLQKLLNAIIKTEASYKAIIVTNEKEIIEDYFEQKLNIQPQIEKIKLLTTDDYIVQAKIDTIQKVINQRINFLDQHIYLDSKRNQGIYKSALTSSAKLVEDVEDLIEEIIIEETLALNEKESLRDKKYRINPLLLLTTVLFSLFIFVIGFIALYYYLKKARKTLYTLKVNQMIYEQAEQISRSGHWHYRPGSNKITFSTNLFRLLGFEPYSFKPSLKKYLDIISVNDRPNFLSALKKLKSEGHTPAIDLTIITPDGKEKCLRFVARLLNDNNGNKLVVGANKDLTYEIETNKKLNRLNSDLKMRNNIFKYAESIAMVGSYSYDFEKKEFKFSDNLYKMLGFKPENFPPSESKFVEFIHIDDRADFIEKMGLENVMNNFHINRIRIIDNNGNVKYLSVNKKIFNEDNSKILIVAFKDITEEVLITKRLEEKNEELSKSNEELESFNHIASHDLQEPLRKIHTFISRIRDSDDLNASPLIVDYLSRIRIAANRMQKLVIDLLSFSRASKDSDNFEFSNLNKILKSALHELNSDIQEKQAIINYDELPSVTIISFQFQQLFVNLISNALKYSKHNIRPVIKISNEKLTFDELLKFPHYNETELVKITFEDNGIGFEQQYADVIFILFQRLHDRKKYSGTGIGLAICKKILHNHRGSIFAEGRPEVGSKFTIIFPKTPVNRSF
ncbi:PAS domain-containing protein [Marivirga sp. S37H4]|uniref:histidine kinase n=1 Tax=Marivirga aurantiaca TaxID=2802615 RepID=A0A935C714_9BACT|nr:ATP-binding protein [Marivirga aurantiaca]MBK6264087.1 PAS domain-containing protein [Marivirga aurantiaca]